MNNHETFNPDFEPRENSEFTRGLENFVSPADLDVLKGECPTDPEQPLVESAEDIGKE